jgi:uncharacterized protein (TIGR03067 family)
MGQKLLILFSLTFAHLQANSGCPWDFAHRDVLPITHNLNTPHIMKYILWMCLIVSVSFATFAADSPDAKAIEGSWIPIKAELGGQPMADAILKTITLKLIDGKYEAIAGGHPDNGTYTLDATTKPKGMTVTGTNGPNNGKTFPCIYELKNDTLRICYDLSGKKRPVEFKSVAAMKLYLVTYQRKK